MAAYNHVVLVGNITRDIELKTTPTGDAVTDIGLAVNDGRRNNDGKSQPMFIDCVCFGRLAELCKERLVKGSLVLFAGRLKFDVWENDGRRFTKHKIIVDRMQMVGDRNQRNGDGDSKSFHDETVDYHDSAF